MKINPFLKLISISVLVALVVGTGSYFVLSQLGRDNPKAIEDNSVAPSDIAFGWKYPTDKYPVVEFPAVGEETDSPQIAYSSIRDPGGIPQGLPMRLKIPVIGVDSAVEDALITPDGRMDVPSGSRNVAWFALGPHPGRTGSAVIGGHFGIANGVPFVFYKLDELKIGDKVYIVNDKGETLAFQVRRIQLFERDADATTVFTSDDGLAHLNLITCEGIWNRVNDTYPQRRVVFTDAISSEGAITVDKDVAAVSRVLSIGMRGTDVAALQTLLVEKGFLVMPAGVAKGYFGTLTRTAVYKYQVSVGLPLTGIFDSATRVSITPEPIPIVIKPTLPTTATPSEKVSIAQIILQSLKGLYATPMDGLVTSLLIIAIVFTVFNIIKDKFKKPDLN